MRLRWVWYALAISLLVSTVTVDSAHGQFLSRDFRRLWANEVFENYGVAGYRDFDFDEENRRFDFFGDLLIDGVDIVNYSEIRRDSPGIPGSFESRNARYDRFFDKLVIANEGVGPWSTRLIIGDHIRTFFTPMTLNLPRFNGVRWDGASKKNRFSVLATQLTDPIFVPSNTTLDQTFEERRIFGTSLFGGHWESQIGGILKIGTSYVNTHRFDAEASSRVNTLKGVIPRTMNNQLRKVFVFFTDDAPQDGSPGAAVYGLTLKVGEEMVEPSRVGRIENLLDKVPVTTDVSSTILLDPGEVDYLRRNRAWLKGVAEASNQPFFGVLMNEIVVPVATPPDVRNPQRADGTDVLVYEFSLPDTTRELIFEAVVADDYSIDVVGAMRVPTLAAGEDDFYYDWFNAKRAEGTPAAAGNLRRVRFNYGFPTGVSVVGLNFEAELFGFSASGEFARSTSFFRAPAEDGKRHAREASTFYLNVSREVGERALLGFEYFDVPHDYTTEFSIFRRSSRGPTLSGRLYQPFEMVEDNDDLDQWPDRLEHNDPLMPYTRALLGGNGVFPGLDPNGDGVLDFDVDRAGGVDAFQPFLAYFAEPPELVYGDDFDNNGVADFRENDNLPDYAYPADHKGVHAFARYEFGQGGEVRLGDYRVDRSAIGDRNHTTYLEGAYRREWNGLGYVRLNHRLKWVEDDIENTVYNVSPSSLRPDLLQNRDSVNNLSYFEAALWAVPNVNVRNIVSFNHIDLRGEVMADPLLAKPGTITHLTMVNKVDYTYEHGRLRVSPQLKHIYQRSKFPERAIPNQQRRWIMPILRADFRLGPRTQLRTGIQGLPLLRERSLDSANPEQDFRRTTYTAFIQNSSNYLGYDLSMLMGIYRTRQVFTGSSRPSSGFLEYFFRVFIG